MRSHSPRSGVAGCASPTRLLALLAASLALLAFAAQQQLLFVSALGARRARILPAPPRAHSGAGYIPLALDESEAARQLALLAELRAEPLSRARPLAQPAGRPPVVLRALARERDLTPSMASVCARATNYFARVSASADEALFAQEAVRRFGRLLPPGARGAYIESGALDGIAGSLSLFFDEVLRWRGLLVEANPPNFAQLVVARPHAVRLECALWEGEIADDGGHLFLEFVGDHGSAAGAAGVMGREHFRAFHGDRDDRYNVSACSLRSYLPLTGIGARVDLWVLDVEGAELHALRGFPFDRVAVWLIVVELNDSHGPKALSAVRAFLLERGFALVAKVGIMNELFENEDARPVNPEPEGAVASAAGGDEGSGSITGCAFEWLQASNA